MKIKTLHAWNGKEAVEMAKKRSDISLVLMDILMPEMDGIALQKELVARHSPLQVIVMTGHADIPIAVGAMKAGAVDFLEKPFDEPVLLDSVGGDPIMLVLGPDGKSVRVFSRNIAGSTLEFYGQFGFADEIVDAGVRTNTVHVHEGGDGDQQEFG